LTTNQTIEKRELAGSELTVSRACLGTMTFGAQTDAMAADRMVRMCLERGINFFDTANVYNAGESERLLGQVLGNSRKDIILASKVGMKAGEHPAGLTKELIVTALEATLRRLNTDYLDLCYLHVPDWQTPIEESLAAMDRLVRDGKVRYVGSSNYPSWQICHMLGVAEKRGYQRMRIAQQMYNLIARRLEDEFLPFAKEFSVSTVVYNPLAGGLLTGKHRSGAPETGTRFDGNQTYLDRYWNRVNLEAVTTLATIAAEAGRSLVSLALNWLLQTPIDCVVLGASRLEQLEENLRALDDGPLEQTSVTACDNVWRSLYGPSPKYSR
jgi:aryl-alcohol dehydrogenase-like predicted oxidoreductase